MNYLLEPRIWILLLLLIIGFLCVVSDRLFVVLYAIPMALSCVILFRRMGLRKSIALVVVIAVFVTIGVQFFLKIDRNTYVVFDRPDTPLDTKAIYDSWMMFKREMIVLSTALGFRALSIWLFVLSLPFMVYLFFKSLKNSPLLLVFYSLFSIIFTLAVISAPILTGKFTGFDSLRYNVYPLYFAGLNWMVFIAWKVQRSVLLKIGAVMVAVLTGWLLLFSIWQINFKGLQVYFNYYPEIVSQIDAIAGKENLKYGVGNYWDAKKITMFSKKGVRVYSVFDDIAIYDHVANDEWFFNNVFDFVVFNNFSDTTLYTGKLKNVRRVYSSKKLKVAKASPFWYYKGTGYRALNIGYKED